MGLTDILAYYLHQYPFLIEYFDFLRDAFLGIQIITILIFILISKKRGLLIYYLFIFIFAYFLTEILKLTFHQPRPVTFYFSYPGLFDSFPSRHTTISFAFSFALIFQNFKLGIFSFALSFLIAIFSWFSLMHWPLDIIFGIILGFLVFLFSRELLYLFHWFNLQKRKSKG